MSFPPEMAKQMGQMTQLLGGMGKQQIDIEISQPQPESYDKTDVCQSDKIYLRFHSGRIDIKYEQLILDTKVRSTSGATLLWVWEGLKTGTQIIRVDKKATKIVGELKPAAVETPKGSEVGCLFVIQSPDNYNLKVKFD